MHMMCVPALAAGLKRAAHIYDRDQTVRIASALTVHAPSIVSHSSLWRMHLQLVYQEEEEDNKIDCLF